MKKFIILFLISLGLYAQTKIGIVTSPNGGEFLTGDSVFTIKWSNNTFHPSYANVSSISIDYSTNNGVTFTSIVTGLSKVDSSYNWNVPALNVFNVCRVRVLYRNISNQVIGGDTSDAVFSIDSKPFATITLTSPTNGKWTNNLPTLKWTASGFSSDADSLVLMLDGVRYATLSKTTTSYTFTNPISKGWHTWTIRVVDARKNFFQPLSVYVFRVDDEAPFQFSLDRPVNNSFTNNYYWNANQINEFKWLPSADTGSGLRRYYLYVDGNPFLDTIPAAVSILNNRLLFFENFEAGLSRWTNVGGWGLVSQNYYSSSTAVTESPAGNYTNNLNAILTLKNPILLKNIKDLRVSYWTSYKLEKGDFAYFDISFNGINWQNIASYTGNSKLFLEELNITPYVGINTQLYLRFRVVSNSSGTNDGFYVDDIKVTNLEKRLSSGNHTWFIVAQDSVGNTRQSNNTLAFTVDTIAPQGINGIFENVSPSNNFWTKDSVITFNWLPVADAVSGLKEYQIFINNNLVQDSLTTNNYTLSLDQNLPSGNYVWRVKAFDNVNNVNVTTPFNLFIDHTPPKKFNLLSPNNNTYINNPNPLFTWQASADSGIGLSKYQLIVDNQVNIDSIPINKTQTNPNPANLLSEGIHTWYIKAFDKLNNQISSNDARTIVVDWTAPIITTLTYPLENNIIDNPFPTFKWLPTTDNLSGVSHYNLYLDNKLVASNIPHLAVDTIKFKAVDSLQNGNHTWYVVAFDKSGNFVKSEVKNFTANIDYTPPVAQFTNLVNNQVVGGNSYLIIGTARDNIGGVGLSKIQLSLDGAKNWTDINFSQPAPKLREVLKKQIIKENNLDENDEESINQILNQTVYWDYNWQAYTDGNYDIRLRAIDKNNNIQNPIKVNVVVDKTLPTINSINIANKYINAGIKTVQITFKTSSKTSMDTTKTVNVEVITPNNLKLNVVKTAYANNVWLGEVSIPSGAVNGKSYIKVTSGVDKINNTMRPDSSIFFYIDTQAPTLAVISSPKNQAFLNVLKPKITWSQARDTLAGLDHYELEINGSTNPPGKSWISPTRVDTFPSANLNQTTNVIRIKAVDKAGNFSFSQPITFYIDTLKPTSQITSPANGSNITQYPIIVTGTSTDQQIVPYAGIDSVRVRFKKDNKYTRWYYAKFNDTLNKNQWSYVSDITEIGTYYVESYAVDKAGNVQSVPAVNTFTINLGTPTQIYPENNASNIPKLTQFRWSKGLGAKNYHLQVSNISTFQQLLYNDSTLTDTTKTLTNLQNNNTYYWRVRSRDGNTYSAWSSTWSFSTRTAYPILYTSVDTLNMGNVIVKDSLIKTFTVKNTGDDTLKATLTLISELTGFRYKTQNIVLRPFTNDSSVISVKFLAPNILGIANAKITITYGTKQKDVILIANVISHPLVASVDTVKFGEVNLNTVSTKILTLTNNGNDNIVLSSVTLKNATGFSITSSYNYPITIVKGSSINFNIAFLPTQNRSYTGTIEIKSNKPTINVNLTGFGYKFDLGLDSLSLSNLSINWGRSFNYTFRPTGLRTGNVKLFYRKAGDLLYDSVTATRVDSVNYRIKLDSTKITLRGILFYINGTNGTTNVSIPSKLPENNPFNLKINFPSGITAPTEAVKGTNVNAYRMISIPVNEILGYPDTVFAQFSNEYDVKKYRLFTLIDTSFVELGKGNFTRLSTGRGYWFITNTSGKLKSGRGSLYPVNRPYSIVLQPGFNVISSPFNFDISWNDVNRDSTKVSSLFKFDGTFKRTDILKPWEGYLVKNRTNSAITINLIPRPITIAKKTNIALNENEWYVKLSVASDNFIDDDNVIGFKNDASDNIDKYDDIKPVIKFDDYLYLINKEANELLSQNIKKTKFDGDIWNFSIKAKDNSKSIKIKLDEIVNLPKNFKILYLDKENQKSYYLTENEDIILAKEPNKQFNKDFTLIIGSQEFIEKQNNNIKITPKEYSLSQNYPNPFNPETKIKYTLPEKSNVSIKIYNVLGQEVATLVNELQNPGEYITSFSLANYNLSSGVYIYRITAKSLETNKSFIQAKKMIILK